MMAKQLFVATLLAWFGLAGLLPAKQLPPTAHELQLMARAKSKAKVCSRIKRRKKNTELCERWGEA